MKIPVPPHSYTTFRVDAILRHNFTTSKVDDVRSFFEAPVDKQSLLRLEFLFPGIRSVQSSTIFTAAVSRLAAETRPFAVRLYDPTMCQTQGEKFAVNLKGKFIDGPRFAAQMQERLRVYMKEQRFSHERSISKGPAAALDPLPQLLYKPRVRVMTSTESEAASRALEMLRSNNEGNLGTTPVVAFILSEATGEKQSGRLPDSFRFLGKFPLAGQLRINRYEKKPAEG